MSGQLAQLAFTGARPVEIARLTINDVLWGRGCIIIKNDKIGQNRLGPHRLKYSRTAKILLCGLKKPISILGWICDCQKKVGATFEMGGVSEKTVGIRREIGSGNY